LAAIEEGWTSKTHNITMVEHCANQDFTLFGAITPKEGTVKNAAVSRIPHMGEVFETTFSQSM